MHNQQKKHTIAMAWWWTGGHVFPIKSLVEFIQTKPEYTDNIHQIYRFWSKRSLEQEIAAKLSWLPFPPIFKTIHSWKYRRETLFKSHLKNLRDMLFFGIGCIQALFYILYYKIDIIFCKGWYVALPLVIAWAILKKKIVLHESDTHPWIVNKITSRFAQKIFTWFDKVFPKAETVGQILSEEIIFSPQDKLPETLEFLPKIPKDKPRIFVTGWSQGSQRLYQSLLKALETDKSLQNDFIFFITLGKLNQDLKEYFQKFENVFCFDFLSQKEMWILYYYCDLSLTRAGTTSLAEQKLYNMKLFMVPISRTHDQYDNAKRYVQYCDDIMIDQKDENFLNKLIMEFKRHKNFKKELQHTDREQQISITKEKIRDAILT